MMTMKPDDFVLMTDPKDGITCFVRHGAKQTMCGVRCKGFVRFQISQPGVSHMYVCSDCELAIDTIMQMTSNVN